MREYLSDGPSELLMRRHRNKYDRTYGRTSADGTTVEAERPTSVGDFIATIAKGLGVDPTRQNMSNVGRPIRIAEVGSQPIEAIVG